MKQVYLCSRTDKRTSRKMVSNLHTSQTESQKPHALQLLEKSRAGETLGSQVDTQTSRADRFVFGGKFSTACHHLSKRAKEKTKLELKTEAGIIFPPALLNCLVICGAYTTGDSKAEGQMPISFLALESYRI